MNLEIITRSDKKSNPIKYYIIWEEIEGPIKIKLPSVYYSLTDGNRILVTQKRKKDSGKTFLAVLLPLI